MAATQLSLYNGALLILGERGLTSLSENREPRRVLDRIWAKDPVRSCLEQGQWKHAIRRQRVSYNPSITPDFAFAYAFDKPSDFVRTAAISLDEYFNSPLLSYEDQAGYWFADSTEIYVKYVSDDNDYGRDYSLWPKTFEKYVESFLAFESADRIAPSKLGKATAVMRAALTDALSKDAMAGPTKFSPIGSWAAARLGSSSRER